ncbi:hypothetical protein DSUL_20268 [Desulfovibrionales bacterium]
MLVQINGNEGQMDQILHNLMGNIFNFHRQMSIRFDVDWLSLLLRERFSVIGSDLSVTAIDIVVSFQSTSVGFFSSSSDYST